LQITLQKAVNSD